MKTYKEIMLSKSHRNRTNRYKSVEQCKQISFKFSNDRRVLYMKSMAGISILDKLNHHANKKTTDGLNKFTGD